MSAQDLEGFLARVLVDEDARRRFKSNPSAEAERAGLSPEERAALGTIDWVGIELSARSFARKRAHKRGQPLIGRILERLALAPRRSK